MKLTRGSWIRMPTAGHDPNELWQKFPDANGRAYRAWSQHHVGEVVVYQNGRAENMGPCKICGGTTKANCAKCKGQGKMSCEVCKGSKFVPVEWTVTDNPWLNSQPDLIRLKTGEVVLGKIALSSGEDRTIRTREGKILHVNASEIVPKTTTK
jgi:hypothetical protein